MLSDEQDFIYANSSDGFLVADANGKILFFNHAIEQISGFSMQGYLNENMELLMRKKLISRSTLLEAIERNRKVTGKVLSSQGRDMVVTSEPVFDSRGKLHLVVSNVKDTSTFQDIAFKSLLTFESVLRNYKTVQIEGCNHELVYCGDKMNSVIDLAKRVGQVDSTVIVYGETGVGKELIAQLIHDASDRKFKGAFVKVNCASIPENLLEAELFGYEPGAFTGALKSGKMGYFELADKGTIFLDEIGELPISLQAKLLSVLQDTKICKVGNPQPKDINVRIIAATNKSLKKMVKEGLFREDLFYRLNVIPIKVPPLRERKNDIPVLLHHFKNKFTQKYNLKPTEFSPEILNHLFWYPWPGNVRELGNLVERLVVVTTKKNIEVKDLPDSYRSYFSSTKDKFTIHDIAPLKETVDYFELSLIKKALDQSKTQREAANMLQISFSCLSKKLKALDSE